MPKKHEITGPKLQRLLRHGRDPITVLRAQILLSSALGSNIAQLEHEYHLDEAYIIKLFQDFNRSGMDAVTQGTRRKRTQMAPEDQSIVIDLIFMPPRLFGLEDGAWTLDTLLRVLAERRLVQVVEPTEVERLLREHQR